MTGSKCKTVAVLGAGIVGVSTALHLQKRGWQVSLIDRKPAGSETSYGNAGVISEGFIPLNTPHIWRQLPRLIRNNKTELNYSPTYMASNLRWLSGFLLTANEKSCRARAKALQALCAGSINDHRQLMQEANITHRLRDTGWLKLYRSEKAYQNAALERDIYRQLGIDIVELDQNGIQDLEPDLRPVFKRAYLIKSAASVDSPGEVTAAYAKLFTDRGGHFVQASANAVEPSEAGFYVRLGAGSAGNAPGTLACSQVVVALGACSMDLLSPLGYRFPLGVERGYHCHYGASAGAKLSRPCNDVEGSYIITPMQQGLRITSAVELKKRDAPPSPRQLRQVIPYARQAFPLGQALDAEPWLGRRPSLPDCIPAIGQAPRHRGLWLAFGHGHFGFGTGATTGRIVASLMSGDDPGVDLSGLSPQRFM